jgi:aerobic carbon-monoxide dehydrogenase large subunit
MTGFGIGASVKRREDLRLLTGRGRYAEDCNAAGQVYAAFVRSPHAHADVVAIDAAPARAVAGVLDVFTGRDLIAGGVGAIPTLIAERGGGIRNRDGSPFAEPVWYPLATDRVRHVGEPVAIVIGATPAATQDGAQAVAVRYLGRLAVVDAVAALAEGAPSLHAGVARNRAYDWECGDAEATARAIATAAHVTRLALVDNRLVTCFMEPRAALAEWDAGAGRYTLHAGLQSVHQLAMNLARVLGVAAEHVRCVTGDVGGGFGSKIQVYPEYVALAWAARQVGRPVKWVSSRSEGFVSDVQSRDHALTGELALDATGRITALRVRSTSNLGAYVAPSIPISTLSNMERMISGLYDPESGQLLSGSFLDYAIPRADDLPAISVTSRDVPSPTNPLGVKGAGEGGTVGAPGAVIHAILDALAPMGVAHIDMPATPERVWRAIRDAR